MYPFNYYPSANSDLIKQLRLQRHPEGGYFAETDREEYYVPSPFTAGAPRPIATSIYYLLTYDNPSGVIHMNKSVTYHVLHQGRAEYTLIHPGTPPRIEKKIMGTNTAAGEQLQLLVGTGVWKMSRILPDELASAKTEEEKERVGCLITEVVVPGFDWEDHQFLTTTSLRQMFEGVEGGEAKLKDLEPFVKPA
ncbi:hypothetical protein JAAARDRAFT_167525 [Jaapia argillacea MUCL 33604]|uniref:DUF985 domain-containing protein n=1 Tax=Jaapia argillacea MUCL 33604 TaxID=933084 RepID=A0A067QQA1_9AGAM|nr:hypothetical protein JAAARDRAFT_167525 [Jaapia argillacea MUCL 33604]